MRNSCLLSLESVWNNFYASAWDLIETGRSALAHAHESCHLFLQSTPIPQPKVATSFAKPLVPLLKERSNPNPTREGAPLMYNAIINNLPNLLVSVLYCFALKKANKNHQPLTEKDLKHKEQVLKENYQIIVLNQKQKKFEDHLYHSLGIAYDLLSTLRANLQKKPNDSFIEEIQNQIQELVIVHDHLIVLARELPHYQEAIPSFIKRKNRLEQLQIDLTGTVDMEALYRGLITFNRESATVPSGTANLVSQKIAKKKIRSFLKQQEAIVQSQSKEACADLRSATFIYQDFKQSVQEYLKGKITSQDVKNNFKMSIEILHELCSEQNTFNNNVTTSWTEEFNKQRLLGFQPYSLFNNIGDSNINRINQDLLTNDSHKVI